MAHEEPNGQAHGREPRADDLHRADLGAPLLEPVPIDGIDVAAFTFPTDAPEGDGTLTWNSTTIVVVEAHAGGDVGLGYTYAPDAAATLVYEELAEVVRDLDAMNVRRAWNAMVRAVRNVGRPGIASAAISAVDAALWDLKARLLGLPLYRLLGAVRDDVPLYGSGGFTTYDVARLREQLAAFVAQGFDRVKMKVGSHPRDDVRRVEAAREAIGSETELFVDANGAYARKRALAMAEAFASAGVTWFEEPVSSDDLEGLRFLRDRGPAGMNIAAGEYGYDLFYFRRMLEAGAVDVLQADATRCLGITGFLDAGALSAAHDMDLSGHTAPSLHLHAMLALPRAAHLEYFWDHARIERLIFEGVPEPRAGRLAPDPSRPGLGLTLKRADARRFAL